MYDKGQKEISAIHLHNQKENTTLQMFFMVYISSVLWMDGCVEYMQLHPTRLYSHEQVFLGKAVS